MPGPQKDNSNNTQLEGEDGGDLNQVHSDATSMALALGAVPLRTAMPHHDQISDALAKLAKVRKTEEYQKLVQARANDEITRDEFHEAVRVLANRLDAEHKLD